MSEQLNLVEVQLFKTQQTEGGATSFGLFTLCRVPVPLSLSGKGHISTRDCQKPRVIQAGLPSSFRQHGVKAGVVLKEKPCKALKRNGPREEGDY